MIAEFAITRSVRDTAALLDVLAGPMPGDPYAIHRNSRPYCMEAEAWPDPLRIGLLKTTHNVPVHPECIAAVDAVARKLEELGHTVVEAHPTALTDGTIDSFAVPLIGAAQAHAIEQFEARDRAQDRTRRPRPRQLDAGRDGPRRHRERSTSRPSKRCTASRRRVGAWWEGFDLLISPTLPEPSPPIGELVPRPGKPLEGFLRSAQLTTFLDPLQRDRAARDLAAAALERRRTPDRRAGRGRHRSRGPADPRRRATRRDDALGRPSSRPGRLAMRSFRDKVAVVTGAASGIGRALAPGSGAARGASRAGRRAGRCARRDGGERRRKRGVASPRTSSTSRTRIAWKRSQQR